MMSRLLILGSTGQIGSACFRYAKSHGHSTILAPTHAELELTDQRVVDEYFHQYVPSVVILAAGISGGIGFNQAYPVRLIQENLAIQLAVIRAAHNCGAKKLVFFASSCIYPRDCPQPMSEDFIFQGMLESTSLAYATAKIAGLQLCEAYNQQHSSTQMITLLPNTVYGPNSHFEPERGHVLTSLIQKMLCAKEKEQPQVVLWGSGLPRREFIYADDLAAAVFTVLSVNLDNVKMPINIGVGEDYSIQELADKIAKVIGYRGEIIWDVSKPDGASRKLLDNRKIKNLGWHPKIDLETGIRYTCEWFIAQREGIHDSASI